MTTYSHSIVALDRLELPEYQRGREENRIKEIAANWNPGKVGVIILARREDGRLVILDGSHRVGGGILAGVTELPALIYEDLSVPEEAEMFLGLNDSRKVQPVDKFKAAVIANDPMAVEINAALHDFGWRVSWSSDPGNFAAVTAAKAVYKGAGLPGCNTGLQLVRRTIEFITRTWGHDRDGMQGYMFRAVASVLARYEGQIDVASLSERLSKTPASHFLADGRRMGEATRQHRHAAIARVMIHQYNKRRRSGVVPDYDWKS